MSHIRVFMLITVLAVSFPAVSDAQLVPYDDFRSALIDPEKWSGFSTNAPVGPTTEVARQLKGGQLQLSVNQYGRADLNGGGEYGNTGVNFRNPTGITTIQATVRILLADASSCPANSSLVRGAIHANLFNDGNSGGPGDRTGDIQAVFSLAHSTNLGNTIQAEYFRCANSTCSSSTLMAGQTLSGTWRMNEIIVMTLTWDAANDQILYSITRGKVTETVTLSYALPDTSPPAVPFKNLIAEASIANCVGDRQHGFVSVSFDNVLVNP